MSISTLRVADQSNVFTPKNINEAMQMAEAMARSSIIPRDFQGNPGNILVAMQWGSELGMAPLQAMQNVAVINGRPCLWGDALIAIVRNSPMCEYVKESIEGSGENMIARCIAKRRGQDEEIREFTVNDAKRARLWGKAGPWSQYPKRMLQMRARAFALRDVFADVLKGMSSAEEQQDVIEKDVGRAEVVEEDVKAIEHYPSDEFEKNVGRWITAIKNGRMTAEAVIQRAATKGQLTKEQIAVIKDAEVNDA